jgi:hypothetical protein
LRIFQPRFAKFGAEDQVDRHFRHRLGHTKTSATSAK